MQLCQERPIGRTVAGASIVPQWNSEKVTVHLRSDIRVDGVHPPDNSFSLPSLNRFVREFDGHFRWYRLKEKNYETVSEISVKHHDDCRNGDRRDIDRAEPRCRTAERNCHTSTGAQYRRAWIQYVSVQSEHSFHQLQRRRNF